MAKGLQNVALTSLAIMFLFWLDWLYDTSLRDHSFFSGWVLFTGMAAQWLFHIRKQLPMLPLGRAASWLKSHIYMGYFVIAAFLLHTEFSWPDNMFEWTLWSLFALVASSGVMGAYLSWSVPAKLEQFSGQITFDTIPAIRYRLEKKASDLAISSVSETGSLAISDVYANVLHGFFVRPQNLLAHLRGSQRPLRQICDELTTLERYVDEAGKTTLRSIKNLAVAKDRLDFQYAHQGLLHSWLFIHIPATYCLIVVVFLHVAIIYAYSSGAP